MPYVGGRLPEFLARIKGDVQMRHPALIGRLGTFVAELDAEDDAAILAGGCDPDITFEGFPILRSLPPGHAPGSQLFEVLGEPAQVIPGRGAE